MPLSQILVASIVAVQEAKRVQRMVHTFGQVLTPDLSRALKERVAAIEQQYKDTLIGTTGAFAQLAALGLTTEDQNALVARWAATMKKSPGAAILINPITGQPG